MPDACRKIGLLGGSFDPVHHGHLIVARSVLEQLGLDVVVFLPSGTPPHKREVRLTEGDHRAAMVRLAIAGESGFEFSDYDLTCGGPSYTVDTVRHFREVLADGAELFWIIGADMLVELHTWYKPAEIASQCRIVTASRPGFEPGGLGALRKLLSPEAFDQVRADVLETPRIDIAATEIRERVAAGRSIRYLVPEPVREYIEAHNLYGAKQ